MNLAISNVIIAIVPAELFGRSGVVFGKIFPEGFCDHVGEREFVVYAVVRDALL